MRCAFLLLFAPCLLLAACGGAVAADPVSDAAPGDSIPDAIPPRAPKQHRPSAATCSPSGGGGAGPCSSGYGGPGSCKSDADCTKGTNGHCAPQSAGILVCGCFYDDCAKDSDCGSGQVCACQGTPYQSRSNSCSAGNCKVDSDCGPSGYCSPTESTSGCGGTLGGYFCHTASDECVDDGDCTSTAMAPQLCGYDATAKRWACIERRYCA